MESDAGAAPALPDRLPVRLVLGLSLAHGGVSILINTIGILLVFFYLPPDTAGLPILVDDRTFLGVLNAIVVVAALGRFADAVTDPWIASRSDRSRHPFGRRLSFMRVGLVPAAALTFAMFFPPVSTESGWNIAWLVVVQLLTYVALTAYVTPAFSLVADLGRTPTERLDLATATSAAWAVGVVVAGSAAVVASAIQEPLGVSELRSFQIAVGVNCVLAAAIMAAPLFLIDEPRWTRSGPTDAPLLESLRVVFANPFFRYYVAADFAYFSGLMIIQTGVLYYVTVLLELDEALVAPLLVVMVVAALLLYPVVNRTAKRIRPKLLVVASFALAAVVFATIFGLGRYPAPPLVQAVLVIVAFAVPFALLSVLPQAILSDITEHAALAEGRSRAAMFFAARTFLQKIGQTFGVVVFALLLTFGRDVGDDLGIRLSGLAGVALYAVAAATFARYDEERLYRELSEAGGQPGPGGTAPGSTVP